ncbi:hypothetical protein Slin15195_G003830 [Septoria linicola]|uniref:BZIP domain-containing protein n=1 Tax=Septoria linicola TaxID=215465 RepID=A0A9Q9AGC4_9PEZI|nr:hypothetical protein Slin14017_G003860 [Septoria linicola]USW47064.1 hypothetical protein Slin15195_G003830 [Septoria linicola]
MADFSRAPMTVTNENWKGKNDPAERRRIQNRINQRAFRKRQREGESPKAYRARLASSGSASPQEEEPEESTDDQESSSSATPSINTSPSPAERQYDELARLINRNFQAAASTNAYALGIGPQAVRQPELGLSLRPTKPLSAGLNPIAAQYQVPHDLIFDILPHPRLRYNILKAIVASQIDATALSNDLRLSGALDLVCGSWQRCGLIVWGAPGEIQSWEISIGFLRRWGFLLQGCEDLLAVTNAWRAQRGEAAFPASVNVSSTS